MTAQQAMRTAWQIRKAAAAKYGVKVSEIMFAPCLKMAWAGKTMEPKIQDKEIRMVRGQKVQVKVWENYGKKRYYFEVLGERGAGASSQDVQMAYDCGRKEFCDCKNNLLKSKRLNLICKAAWEQEMIQVWGL